MLSPSCELAWSHKVQRYSSSLRHWSAHILSASRFVVTFSFSSLSDKEGEEDDWGFSFFMFITKSPLPLTLIVHLCEKKRTYCRNLKGSISKCSYISCVSSILSDHISFSDALFPSFMIHQKLGDSRFTVILLDFTSVHLDQRREGGLTWDDRASSAPPLS